MSKTIWFWNGIFKSKDHQSRTHTLGTLNVCLKIQCNPFIVILTFLNTVSKELCFYTTKLQQQMCFVGNVIATSVRILQSPFTHPHVSSVFPVWVCVFLMAGIAGPPLILAPPHLHSCYLSSRQPRQLDLIYPQHKNSWPDHQYRSNGPLFHAVKRLTNYPEDFDVDCMLSNLYFHLPRNHPPAVIHQPRPESVCASTPTVGFLPLNNFVGGPKRDRSAVHQRTIDTVISACLALSPVLVNYLKTRNIEIILLSPITLSLSLGFSVWVPFVLVNYKTHLTCSFSQ